MPLHVPPGIGLAQSAGPHSESPYSATKFSINPSIVNAARNGQEAPRIANIKTIHLAFSKRYRLCRFFCITSHLFGEVSPRGEFTIVK